MIKIGLLIYARSSSKRFPNKVLKKIYLNKCLLEIIILRLKKYLNYKIFVCTSKLKSDDRIVNICKKNKVNFFRGELNNVFQRTRDCIKKNKIDSFVRINADRPFVDFKEIKRVISLFNKSKADIVTNNFKKDCPKGLVCEVSKSNIFLNFDQKKLNKKEREHIFNYFYRNKRKYKIVLKKNKLYTANRKKNFSIDNFSDFVKIKKIFTSTKNIYIQTDKVLKNYNNEF